MLGLVSPTIKFPLCPYNSDTIYFVFDEGIVAGILIVAE